MAAAVSSGLDPGLVGFFVAVEAEHPFRVSRAIERLLKIDGALYRAVFRVQRVAGRLRPADGFADGIFEVDDAARLVHGGKLPERAMFGEGGSGCQLMPQSPAEGFSPAPAFKLAAMASVSGMGC